MAFKKLKYWFDGELALLLSDKIVAVNKGFDSSVFVANVKKKTEPQELKDRVETIADELHSQFPDFGQGAEVMMQILGPENEKETGMFSEYYWIMPIAKYVEKYGLEEFNTSMRALEEITKRNTSEYAIRPFIVNDTARTMRQMIEWSNSPNSHVRRLASEGGRPRLPWAAKLDMFISDPSPLLPILDNLKDDKSKYVQKSVANCINDILKDNPAIAKSLIEDWSKGKTTPERKWIIKHSLRNLLKAKDEWALSVVG